MKVFAFVTAFRYRWSKGRSPSGQVLLSRGAMATLQRMAQHLGLHIDEGRPEYYDLDRNPWADDALDDQAAYERWYEDQISGDFPF